MQKDLNAEEKNIIGGNLLISGGVSLIIAALVLLASRNPLDYVSISGKQLYNKSLAVENKEAHYVSGVVNDASGVWNDIFSRGYDSNNGYHEPALVMFSAKDEASCGYAFNVSGSFYCSHSKELYIDLTFYNELQTKFKHAANLAMAYVIAHEVGHHVQHLLNIPDRISTLQESVGRDQARDLAIKLELQADFLAGVWAHYTHALDGDPDEADIAEALQAATAIGYHFLQKRASGYIVPDSFTHGQLEERVYWFMRGYESGKLSLGDPFHEMTSQLESGEFGTETFYPVQHKKVQ